MATEQAERVIRPTRRIDEVLKTQRPPTIEEAADIADVHQLAERFAAGTVQLAEIRAATTGYQRWTATRFTPRDDPIFPALMAMLDALIAARNDAMATDQGTVELPELIEARGKIVHAGTEDLDRIGVDAERGEVVCFPVRQPWATPPDPKHGVEGVRGEPVYRPREQWGQPAYSSFAVVPRSPIEQSRETAWWNAGSDDDHGD